MSRSRSGVAMSTTARKATTAAASSPLNGIDVASFQHNSGPINWAQVASGNQFAAIKATEGSYTSAGKFYVNPYYASDAASAVQAGMYVAAYAFANPFNGTGAAQADWAWQNAGNYKVGGQYLPLMLDLEYNPYKPADGGNDCYGLSPAQMVSWISSFMTEATAKTGAAPIIYTPRRWWNTCTGNSTAFGGNVLWVAAYSAGSPGTLPFGWDNWNFWQYTGSGSVAGVSGSVDLDSFSGGPQSEQTAQNVPVSIKIQTLNSLAGQQVTYSATGLPPGVTMSSAGQISGAATAQGTYQVTVTPQGTGTILPSTVSFTWTVGPAPAVAVGAEGTDGQLWAQAPQLGPGWHPLGGRIVAAPAVAAAPNPNGATPSDPLFIGTGADQRLWIRSATAGWQPVGGARCIGGPGALITGSTLTVACRGADNALWYDTATVPASGLPAFTGSWTSLGGVLAGGPAVAPVVDVLAGGPPVTTFFVRGSTGQVYTRTLTTGYAATPWTCAGQPAAALQAATGNTIFGCDAGGALYESVDAGYGWSPATSIGGSITGGPGVGPTTGLTELFAEGTDHAVWERTPVGWTGLGGAVTGGVGAAALN